MHFTIMLEYNNTKEQGDLSMNQNSNNPVMHVANAIIDDINADENVTYVTISYVEHVNRRPANSTLRLIVGRTTTILNEMGNFIPVTELTPGMIVNATFSSATTRSLPPQSVAYLIRVVRSLPDSTVTGNILEIDRENRTMTTIQGQNRNTIIRFNVPQNTPVFDRNGASMNFNRLMPGMRVRVRHADFMTLSIPPQTTAFEIRVL